jgi:hypothetical protein
MLDELEDRSGPGFWPAVSDLFMSLFIVGLVIIAAVYYVLLPKNRISDDRTVIQAVGADLAKIRNPVNAMRRQLGREELRSTQSPRVIIDGLGVTAGEVVQRLSEMNDRISRLETQNNSLSAALSDKPPIIRIDESKKEYRFASGSAVMDEAFKDGLRQNQFMILGSEILKRNGQGKIGVDTLEIIGHTDGQAVRGSGNLDDQLPDLLAGKRETLENLRAGSNNDLGLLRALAVKAAWLEFVSTHPDKSILERVEVRCYSAGQTIPPEGVLNPSNSDTFRGQNQGARRIEIRLTRLKNASFQ